MIKSYQKGVSMSQPLGTETNLTPGYSGEHYANFRCP